MPNPAQAKKPLQQAASTEKEVILVTGGNGFIGSAIIKKLSEKYKLVSLDKEVEPEKSRKTISYPLDLSSDSSVKNAIHTVRQNFGHKIASVIHLAAYYDFEGKPSPLYDEITVKGSERLIEALQDLDVDQFIFSSSLLVYKPAPPGHKITEDSPLLPKWDYPLSKVKATRIIRAENKDIPVVILRIAGVYNDIGSSIPISNHIQRIYEKQFSSHFYPGNLSYGNPFVHLDDLADAIVLAVEKRKQLPHETIINIGEPETLSYGYLQTTIARLLHDKEWKTYKIPKLLAKAGAWVQGLFSKTFIKPWMIDLTDDHMEIDISKAKELLGWEPRHSLKTTLPKITDVLKADPKAWYKNNKLE
jgi:nucleoside-diphosphate-sugar epimerase